MVNYRPNNKTLCDINKNPPCLRGSIIKIAITIANFVHAEYNNQRYQIYFSKFEALNKEVSLARNKFLAKKPDEFIDLKTSFRPVHVIQS